MEPCLEAPKMARISRFGKDVDTVVGTQAVKEWVRRSDNIIQTCHRRSTFMPPEAASRLEGLTLSATRTINAVDMR